MGRDWSELVQLRGRLKSSISRTWAYAEKPTQDCTLEDVTTRLERIQELWSEFVVITNAMYKFTNEPDYSDPDVDFALYEEKTLVTRSRLRTLQKLLLPAPQKEQGDSMSKLAEQQAVFLRQVSAASIASAAKENDLPKITIPPFTGQYTSWPSFKDLFVSAIHSKPNLTNTQKFHYLKSLLKEDAAQTLLHIPITDKSYDTAWARLNDRYERPRHIVASFIETFMALPSTSTGSCVVLRKISDGANEVVRGLDAINRSDRDCWLIHLLESKLDSESRRKWIEASRDNPSPTITEFFDFLDSCCEELELAQHKSMSTPGSNGKSHKSISRSLVSLDGSKQKQRCIKCYAEDHTITKCPIFGGLLTDDRRSFAKDKSLCFNCLKLGHTSGTCNSKFRCRACNRRHHTLLHTAQAASSTNVSQYPSGAFTSATPGSSTSASGTSAASTSAAGTSAAGTLWSTVTHVARPTFSFVTPQMGAPLSQECIKVLLPTALVNVQTAQGNFIPCRILLDSASELSYISERCAQRLGIFRSHSRIAVTGIASAKAETTHGSCTLFIKSRISEHTLTALVHVLSHITSSLPTTTINMDAVKQLQGMTLADPTFNISAPIDILLGAQHVWNIFTCNKMVDTHNNNLAISTIFGWVVTSITGWEEPSSATTSFITISDVDHSLRRFWEIEEPSSTHSMSADDLFVEQHFQRTHSRHADGRYSVELPFKEENPRFADSLQGALARFHSVERRLSKNTQLRDQYVSFMQQYEALGHMREIQPQHDVTDGRVFYLPHHPVIGPKLRVVFDGSYGDSSGISLNNALHIGPSIQRNLFTVCLRFRFHRFVFSADIVKMFRQIWVSQHHRNFQRIVWRESPDQPIRHYQLCTVTYGTACAPFLSVRVLEQLARDYQEKLPLASRVLLEDFYVDDVLTGAPTEHELIEKRNALIQLLNCAGMELRKWVSNSNHIISDPTVQHDMFTAETTKVLGLYWSPKEDILGYNIRLENTSTVSKRRVLSDASRVFDPLGLLAPVIIQFKIMFQKLWLYKLNWDEPLPPTLAELWVQYRLDLQHVTAISLPRFVPNSTDAIELHGFSDASMKAYAAAVYCRFKDNTGSFVVSLIAAKTRVAPLKPVSLPRLELCGALLLTRLVKLIRDTIPHRTINTYAWCDSTVVLSWLSLPPIKLKTFVANRTSEILDTLPRSVWNHVSSKDNPADCASRGMPAALLLKFELWWKGPAWLRNENELKGILNKTNASISVTDPDAAAEVRTTAINLLSTEVENHNTLTILLDRVSSWQKVCRIVAYIYRFRSRARKSALSIASGSFGFDEINNARLTLLRHAQGCFQEERKALQGNREISSRSKLLKLTPFLDDNQLLRVGGRISHSNLSMDAKHPIILPKQHRVTHLLLSDEHHKHLHPGVSALFVIVRQRYWVLGARNLIRKLTHNCIKCFRQRQFNTQQLMADLPSFRVRQAFPFQNAGCDYAGPITLKLYRGRNARTSKGYICIFVCLTTSAIHVELVTDLTTDCFLAALRRFISRRGKCTQLFSDNGRNFLGASRVLNEMHQAIMSQKHNEIVAESLAMDGIRWNYIPPHAPHWGGMWESAVRSVKLHMRRVIGNNILTVEQMHTLLTQIEAVVNSRPLGASPDSDFDYLSPSHFLIGRPLTMVPEGGLEDININKLDYWQHVQNMYQGFWRRWHQEYLTSLQNRPKWNRCTPNITAGDLVIIKENNTPPAIWPMAKVVEAYPGADGLIRAARLRTARGELTRPITKIAVLPLF